MRSAVSVDDEILIAVEPPDDMAVIIRERLQDSRRGPNRAASIGRMDPSRMAHFNAMVSALQKQHPQIDWSAVATTFGGARRIACYLSEVTRETS